MIECPWSRRSFFRYVHLQVYHHALLKKSHSSCCYHIRDKTDGQNLAQVLNYFTTNWRREWQKIHLGVSPFSISTSTYTNSDLGGEGRLLVPSSRCKHSDRYRQACKDTWSWTVKTKVESLTFYHIITWEVFPKLPSLFLFSVGDQVRRELCR